MSTAGFAAGACCGAAIGVVAGALLLQKLSPKPPSKPRMVKIATDEAAPAGGHYSQAIVNGGEVSIAGRNLHSTGFCAMCVRA